MTPLQQLLAFLLPLLCSLYVLVSAVRACWPRRRNRRVSRTAWSGGQAHPSFWNNDTRGHTECR